MSFLIYNCKTENVGTNIFLKIYKIFSNFVSIPLYCDSTRFPTKNSSNIAKSNCVFPRKERGYRALILTYLDSPMANFFFPLLLIFFDFGHLQDETCGQSWTKKGKLWARFFFMKIESFKFFSNDIFVC